MIGQAAIWAIMRDSLRLIFVLHLVVQTKLRRMALVSDMISRSH